MKRCCDIGLPFTSKRQQCFFSIIGREGYGVLLRNPSVSQHDETVLARSASRCYLSAHII